MDTLTTIQSLCAQLTTLSRNFCDSDLLIKAEICLFHENRVLLQIHTMDGSYAGTIDLFPTPDGLIGQIISRGPRQYFVVGRYVLFTRGAANKFWVAGYEE